MITDAVFIGSKKLGFEVFKALVNTDNSTNWTVLCPPDLDDSRTYFKEFSEFAKKKNLDLLSANSLAMVTQYVRDNRPDVILVCGFYKILPAELLDAVKFGVWGIHNSLLPKYRGGSPLVWQMINNEPYLGSSFFRFSSGVDDGPVLQQIQIPNEEALTIKEASDRLASEWISKIPEIWRKLNAIGDSGVAEQNHRAATYCAQRNENDGLVNWKWEADQIDCFIRAQADPYPRAFFYRGDQKIRIASHSKDNRTVYGLPGQIFEVKRDYVVICCGGNSVLQIHTLELNGQEASAPSVIASINERL